MKQTLVWILIAANVSLGGTLAWRGVRENVASAQAAGAAAARPAERGKYVLIPGDSQQGVSIIYVFDAANRRLGAIAPDAKDMMSSMPVIQLEPVFRSLETGGIRPAGEEPAGVGRNRPPQQPARGGNAR